MAPRTPTFTPAKLSVGDEVQLANRPARSRIDSMDASSQQLTFGFSTGAVTLLNSRACAGSRTPPSSSPAKRSSSRKQPHFGSISMSSQSSQSLCEKCADA